MPMVFSLFKPPNEVKRRRWERIKARGKRVFIWRVGVLQFGGAMFVLMMAQRWISKPIFPRGRLTTYLKS
jgi:hypothetical protein